MTPRSERHWAQSYGHNARSLLVCRSLLVSEINEEAVRGQDGDGAGDQVEQALYLGVMVIVEMAGPDSPDRSWSTRPSCQWRWRSGWRPSRWSPWLHPSLSRHAIATFEGDTWCCETRVATYRESGERSTRMLEINIRHVAMHGNWIIILSEDDQYWRPHLVSDFLPGGCSQKSRPGPHDQCPEQWESRQWSRDSPWLAAALGHNRPQGCHIQSTICR